MAVGADLVQVFGRCVDADLAGADVAGVRGMLADLGRVQSWIDARRVDARRRLDELNRSGEPVETDREIANAARSTARDVGQLADRDKTLGLVPDLEHALRDGAVTGAHVDGLARGLRQLEPADRDTLIQCDGDRLVRLAKRQTPDEFAKSVKAAIADAQSDGGIANLERQRRATVLRCWTDQITGMLELRGSFDPESGLKLTGRLRRLVEELFHAQTPDSCPDDPSLKQDHLRALALIALIDGNTTPDEAAYHSRATGGTGATGSPTAARPDGRVPRAAPPDMIVVIPLSVLEKGRTNGEVVDLGDPDAVLPVETLRRIACTANIIPAVLGTDGVIRDLGRSSRLATKAQRRALRAMYPSCAVHGCRVPFEHCSIHHIRYWEHGGPSDEANFLPLCSKHHHAAHEGGWHLALHPTTRVLTITYPDGTTQTHPPPRARPG